MVTHPINYSCLCSLYLQKNAKCRKGHTHFHKHRTTILNHQIRNSLTDLSYHLSLFHKKYYSIFALLEIIFFNQTNRKCQIPTVSLVPLHYLFRNKNDVFFKLCQTLNLVENFQKTKLEDYDVLAVTLDHETNCSAGLVSRFLMNMVLFLYVQTPKK